MHLQVGDNLHAVVRGGRIVLAPCHCPLDPLSFAYDVKLPVAATALFPIELRPAEDPS